MYIICFYIYIYIYLGISLSRWFVIVCGLFCGEVFETSMILSGILLPIKSPVSSAGFWIALFEELISAFVTDCLARLRSLWLYLHLSFYLCFYQHFYSYFSNRQNSIAFYNYLVSKLIWIARHFLYFIVYLITKVMFVLSSIYGGLEFWSVNHTSESILLGF